MYVGLALFYARGKPVQRSPRFEDQGLKGSNGSRFRVYSLKNLGAQGS